MKIKITAIWMGAALAAGNRLKQRSDCPRKLTPWPERL